jgi:hypothetical protein
MTGGATAAAVIDSARGQTVVLPGQTPAGEHILGVLLKRTYDIRRGARCTRAEADRKLIAGDSHYGDPMGSSVEFEADFVPFKLATDVVLNGTAWAPGGRRTKTFTTSLTVGSFPPREVLVIGDRTCRFQDGKPPAFDDPMPVASMELRYERAYGGVDVWSDPDMQCIYGRNHLGRGFAITNTRKVVEGLQLPNLEDPSDRLTPERLCVGHFMHWERQPMPAGFGWIAKFWQPRALLAGVMPADRAVEEELRQAYALAVPPAQRQPYLDAKLPDIDFRFVNGAPPGLVLPYLEGNEEITATNLSRDGSLTFALPDDQPRIGLDIGEGAQEPPVVLHTVMIRLDDRQLDLVWRAAVPYPGPDWLPQMRKLEVLVQ